MHTSTLPEGIPEFSLGWGVLEWGTRWLNQPDENISITGKSYHPGQPWQYTSEQALFIVHWYAVDENGQWLYERGVLERPKGWGKSPLLSALCATELLGPVAFSHWEMRNGKKWPVGRARMDAWVQIVAISLSQTNNTFKLLNQMLAGKAQDHYNLELMLSKVVAPGDRQIERVTSSEKSSEGNRTTFACLDETHLWLPVDNGPDLAETIRRNLVKKRGRSLETTNAPVPGKNSVAEDSHDTYEQMIAGLLHEDMRLLFDSREVVVENIYGNSEECTKEHVEAALRWVYGDAGDPETGWIDLPRIWRAINDPATKEYDARRFYFNQRVQGEAQWIKDHEWAKAQDDQLILKSTDLITLGFKGVTRNGAAAIVACRVRDGALFLVDMWERPTNIARNVDWELPVARVDTKMRKWLKQERTRYMMADPWTLQDVVGRWSADFMGLDDKPKVEEFWMNQQLRQAKAVDQFEESFRAGRIHHDGSPGLRKHIIQTFTEEQTHGYTLRKDKPHSNRYIVAAQAAVLAYEAAQTAITRGLLNEAVDMTVYGF